MQAEASTPAVRQLLTAPNLEVSAGAELLDENDQVVEDLSEALGAGGKVTRANYSQYHGKCDIGLSRELDWSNARIRLFQTVTLGPQIVQTEVEDRPAVTISQTENTADTWGPGTFTDTIVVAGALSLNHA